MHRTPLFCLFFLLGAGLPAVERPGTVFKVFQFPADRIPRIDGNTDDWKMVPESYVVGTSEIVDTLTGRPRNPADLDIRVRVGWVKGMNRLYVLYEAHDNYWDFARTDLHNDIFELVVDGDLSGGPLIQAMHPNPNLDRWTGYTSLQSVHAQNYHILTPPGNKDWAMIWGCQQSWLRELPYSNAAYSYNVKPGESGKVVLEFWVTPFDYADCDGPRRSIESVLTENKLIGLSWAILDYDDVNSETKAFWNLSHKTTMYGNASDLVAFRLMPMEPAFRKPVEVQWTFRVLSRERRQVAFEDLSSGPVTGWKWDFGDGEVSAEQHPIHFYRKPGPFNVTLEVKGAAGTFKRVKVWDIVLD